MPSLRARITKVVGSHPAPGLNPCVLASGSGKERALETSLASPHQTPLATVIAGRQRTRIFTDINRKASAG